MRILGWVAISSSIPDPGMKPASLASALADGVFTTEPPGKPLLRWEFAHLNLTYFTNIKGSKAMEIKDENSCHLFSL